MSWSNAELEAIVDFADRKQLKLTICSKPRVKFIKKDGDIVQFSIYEVMKDYEQSKGEDRKQKILEKRAEKNKPKGQRFF